MISLKNINKNYKQGNEDLNVIKNLELAIEEKDFISIIGLSGSGKSTLINILGLLDDSFTGEYYLGNDEISKLGEEDKAKIRNENIGFVFQNFNLIEEYTVLENVKLPFLYSDRQADETYIKELLNKLGIVEKENEYPSNLSGGQKQRVAIARALANKPKFIIADEPTGALDLNTRNEILGLLKKLNDDGVVIVLVTHDLEVASLAGKSYELKDGRLVLRKGEE